MACNGKLHSLDNVYIADASCMAYPGAVNPHPAIQAHGLRIAWLIAHKAKSHGSASFQLFVN
ncbi:hypothetical protein [Pseudomonas helleri]|uniref:hypothetical protein n=1 Tax=Pseudomonas helleri TaxID=1608996 RepID=UPI003CC89A5A